ncbi:MAG TPA: hypothetical protein VD846_10755 [Allosphingosinicella sp.]|nr:hypothetical protein [Allosphingosinicella sp.]
MRLALVALALALPAASSAEAPASQARPAAPSAAGPASPRPAGDFVPSRICPHQMGPHLARPADPPRLRRLDELPPGDLTLAVVNQVGGCMEPVIVRQGVGGFGGGPGR